MECKTDAGVAPLLLLYALVLSLTFVLLLDLLYLDTYDKEAWEGEADVDDV